MSSRCPLNGMPCLPQECTAWTIFVRIWWYFSWRLLSSVSTRYETVCLLDSNLASRLSESKTACLWYSLSQCYFIFPLYWTISGILGLQKTWILSTYSLAQTAHMQDSKLSLSPSCTWKYAEIFLFTTSITSVLKGSWKCETCFRLVVTLQNSVVVFNGHPGHNLKADGTVPSMRFLFIIE